MVAQMEQASERLDFEKAAECRDSIRVLQTVVEKQYISGESKDVDIIACFSKGAQACIQVFYIRDGRNLGNRSYFPQLPEASSETDILSAFLSQLYLQGDIPGDIILSHPLNEQTLIEQVLNDQRERKVKLSTNVRGERARWLEMALKNAESALMTPSAITCRYAETVRSVAASPATG